MAAPRRIPSAGAVLVTSCAAFLTSSVDIAASKVRACARFPLSTIMEKEARRKRGSAAVVSACGLAEIAAHRVPTRKREIRMKIVHYPHPALRHAARPVGTIDKKLRLAVGEMMELMYAAKGLGLAAPQVA